MRIIVVTPSGWPEREATEYVHQPKSNAFHLLTTAQKHSCVTATQVTILSNGISTWKAKQRCLYGSSGAGIRRDPLSQVSIPQLISCHNLTYNACLAPKVYPTSVMSFRPTDLTVSLVPRPFPPPVFDLLQQSKWPGNEASFPFPFPVPVSCSCLISRSMLFQLPARKWGHSKSRNEEMRNEKWEMGKWEANC